MSTIQFVDRDEVATVIQAERTERGDDVPIQSRIEHERDLEKLRADLVDAQRLLATAQRNYTRLRESLAGNKTS